MPKSAKKPAAPIEAERETATISYHKGEDAQTVETSLPLQPGQGERLINKAEAAGADVEHVRQQVQQLPHA
jgi:hypothetical protein